MSCIQVTFFLLHAYYFPLKVGQDELELKDKIDQIWDNLIKEARQVDLSLADVKRSFRVVRYHSRQIMSCYHLQFSF